jgi:putative transcriptional regulator
MGVESLRGKLLIAGAGLFDSNFRRSIILVGEHNEEGALGVVLNRPAPVTVEEIAPALSSLVSQGDPMFIGGPVQPNAVVVLAEFDRPDRADLLVFASIGFLTGTVEADAAEAIRRARIFAGYAGWGPGQLEAELEDGSWIIEPASVDDVFAADPEALWTSVLRRKGREYAMLALMPVDPRMN